CDYYEKKMAREAALKSQRVVHADVRQVTPAWTNTNRVNKANQFTPRPVQLSNIRPNFSTASRTFKTGRVNVNTGHGNINSGSVHFNSGTQFKSGASRFNTGKKHVNSGRMYVNSGTHNKSGSSRVNTGKQNVNTARVNIPVLSNQTSQVNLRSPKKCFSKQSSPVNRPFSMKTYEKKMAREAALKSQRVVHADVRLATPAWTNINRVNKANQFTPRPVQLSNIRPNFSTASRTIKTGRVNVNTGKQHVNSGTQIKSGASRFNTGKQHVNSGSMHVDTGRVNRPVSNNTSPKPSQVNLKSPKKCFSKQRSPVNRPFSRNTAHKSNKYAVKGKMGTAVKTSAGCVWRKIIPLSDEDANHKFLRSLPPAWDSLAMTMRTK
ncbi:hypothetical protein Tco_0050000, partial [Tanacetum coccineum]